MRLMRTLVAAAALPLTAAAALAADPVVVVPAPPPPPPMMEEHAAGWGGLYVGSYFDLNFQGGAGISWYNAGLQIGYDIARGNLVFGVAGRVGTWFFGPSAGNHLEATLRAGYSFGRVLAYGVFGGGWFPGDSWYATAGAGAEVMLGGGASIFAEARYDYYPGSPPPPHWWRLSFGVNLRGSGGEAMASGGGFDWDGAYAGMFGAAILETGAGIDWYNVGLRAGYNMTRGAMLFGGEIQSGAWWSPGPFFGPLVQANVRVGRAMERLAIYGLVGLGTYPIGDPFLDVGVGVEFAVGDRLSLTADVRYEWFIGGTVPPHDIRFEMGVNIHLGN